MTGPDHYREAERLIRHLDDLGQHAHNEEAPTVLAEAQVHATLALAAAKADAVAALQPIGSEATQRIEEWLVATS